MKKSVKDTVVRLIPEDLLILRSKLINRRRVGTVLKERKREKYDVNAYPEGVNIMGPVKAEMGLGQSCRLVCKAVQEAGFDYSVQNISLSDYARNGDLTYEDRIVKDSPYGINIIHLEPPELMNNCINFDENLWNGKYNIAFWLWELEEFPKSWIDAIKLVDEIWTPSEFTGECIRKITDKPVKTMPYCVTAPIKEEYDRRYFELPEDKFLYLLMYDANSTMERKNPKSAIEAFKKAFPQENKEVGLVIKMNNPKEKDVEELKALLSDYENIYFIPKILSKEEVNSLIADVDVFVSLHRAEGFGLVMAEAMLNETPCIATNWSSNTEFMNKDVACMVDYDLVTLKRKMMPYEKGIRWADAHTDEAAGYMRRLYEDKEFYNRLADSAKRYIVDKLSPESVGVRVRSRILEIMNQR